MSNTKCARGKMAMSFRGWKLANRLLNFWLLKSWKTPFRATMVQYALIYILFFNSRRLTAARRFFCLENELSPLAKEIEDMPLRSGKIACEGGNQTCADGYTCCHTLMGDYACCPLVNAQCCDDRIHCCPSGSVCDVKGGRCSRVFVLFLYELHLFSTGQ